MKVNKHIQNNSPCKLMTFAQIGKAKLVLLTAILLLGNYSIRIFLSIRHLHVRHQSVIYKKFHIFLSISTSRETKGTYCSLDTTMACQKFFFVEFWMFVLIFSLRLPAEINNKYSIFNIQHVQIYGNAEVNNTELCLRNK